ncbi:MAG: hypothetical protein FJZ01_23365 [Candidatus Sericytochromatia bacterium]|nr:hypothetical protein [Candidatus Tanganyikabacteria bacterium]
MSGGTEVNAHRKPSPGVTLIEVVLATSIAGLFITAFMFQYRVQQTSYQAASDELRLPAAAAALSARLLGMEGFGCAAPSLGMASFLIAPRMVQFPVAGALGANRTIAFYEDPGSPLPAGLRPGVVGMMDSGAGATPCTQPAITSRRDLTPQGQVRDVAFYSPDLVTFAVGPGAGTVTSAADVSAGRVMVGGTTAFYVLGASSVEAAGPKALYVEHSAGEANWRFGFSNPPTIPIAYQEGEVFVINDRLVCAWAGPAATVTSLSAIPNSRANYTFNATSAVRRIGFWLKLATSQYGGTVAIRNSAFMRN